MDRSRVPEIRFSLVWGTWFSARGAVFREGASVGRTSNIERKGV